MVVALSWLALLAACGGEGDPAGGGAPRWSDYLGLDAGAAWSWREADAPLDSGGADVSAAIRGRHLGDGYVEMRLGDPWADALDLGFLSWDASDGIVLSDWRLGGVESSGPRRFAYDRTEPGEAVSNGAFGCVLSVPAEPRTVYYGTFEDTVELACDGDPALAGLWVFARGHGLVRVQAGIADWELIGPL